MNQPRPEARITAQERLTTILAGRIEELAEDTDANFRALRQDISQLSDKVDLGFRQAHAYIDENMATKEDVSRLETRFDKLESEHGQKFDSIQTQLTQILTLLQQKPS